MNRISAFFIETLFKYNNLLKGDLPILRKLSKTEGKIETLFKFTSMKVDYVSVVCVRFRFPCSTTEMASGDTPVEAL